MLLDKITIENVGIYGGRNEFELASDVTRPIVLYGGTNGAGKTTLFESIRLCLYGQKYDGAGTSAKTYHQNISRLLHKSARTGKRATEAVLFLKFQQSHRGVIHRYEIRRAWENDHGRILESLSLDITDDTGTTRTVTDGDAQAEIDNILPVGIANLFFFDGEKVQDMAEQNKDDVYIRSSLNMLFGLDIAEQLYADLATHLKRNADSELADIIDGIDADNRQKEDLVHRIESNKDLQAFLEGDVQNTRKELGQLEERFAKVGGKFAQRRTDLTEKKAKLEAEIDGIKTKIMDICDGMLPFGMLAEQLKDVRHDLESDIRNGHSLSEKKILKDAFADIKKEIGTGANSAAAKGFAKQLNVVMAKKLESVSASSKTTFPFSNNDAQALISLIDDVVHYDYNVLERLSVDLASATSNLADIKKTIECAPKQDEIGPLFSDIMHMGKIIADMEDETEQLKNLESQYRSELVLLNSDIRKKLSAKKTHLKRKDGLDLAPRVQAALLDYMKNLRIEKSKRLADNILDGLQTLLHKTDFVSRVEINPDTFEVRLYRENGDEITRHMLSTGELQIYSTAIIWGLAKTSGRSMPFVIDTPLARLDTEHRANLIDGFYPSASHQVIIFSTNSEITREHYDRLLPHIARSTLVEYDSKTDQSSKIDGYFYDKKEEKEIEV